MKLVNLGPSEEWSTDVDGMNQPLEDQGPNPKFGRGIPELEVQPRRLPQDLHIHPSGSGTNGQLRNRFQLIEVDSESLQSGRGDDVGESIAAVNVGCSLYISYPDRDVSTVVTRRSRARLYLCDSPDFVRKGHGCKNRRMVSSVRTLVMSIIVSGKFRGTGLVRKRAADPDPMVYCPSTKSFSSAVEFSIGRSFSSSYNAAIVASSSMVKSTSSKL